MKISSIFIEDGKSGGSKRKLIINTALLLMALGAIIFFVVSRMKYTLRWDSVIEYRSMFIDGFVMTIIISVFSLFLSILLGVLFAFGRRSKIILVKQLSTLYIELIRGTPLLVQILVFFYVVFDAVGIQNRYVAGVLILSFFSGAYVCEIIRAGIESVGKTQLESARSLGLNKFQIYQYVIIPQLLSRTLPPLAGQLATLIKDSSLLSIISISEFTMNAQQVNAYTFSTLESYLPLAVGYLALSYPISAFSRMLERRMSFDT